MELRIKGIVTSFATVLAASAFAAALPEGYQQLEFVQSTGNAYIDLDYIPGATDRLEVDISLPQTLSDNVQGILCSRDDGNTASTRIMLTVSKDPNVGKGAFDGFYSTQELYPIYYPEDNERVVIAIDGMSSKVFANGVFRGHLTAGNTFTPTTKLRLFALKSGNGVSCYTAMKLYGFKAIAANGTIRSECVPCINAEGVRGVYDFAAEDGAGKFFPSSNGNVFTGPLLRLPNDYEELEYIESSDTDNAYMNLELVPNSTDRIESKFAVTKTDLAVQGLYCARASTADKYPQIMMVMYSDKICVFCGQDGKYGPFNWKVNEPHLITLDLNALKFAVDEKEVDLGKLMYTPTAPLRLFALWSGSAPSACCAARLYTFTWWTREGNLREKLVPARKKNGQVVGLYDLVQCRFFTNANSSGSFTAGPVVSNKWLVEPSLSKVTWATNERPGEIRIGLAKCGEVSCSCTADDLLALGVGSHDVVFSVAAGEGYGALQKTVSVTVTAPFVPTVDSGDVTAKVVRNAEGSITGAKLVFPQADVERDCVVVWDRCDKGVSVANWANRQTVAKIPAGATAATIDLPEPLKKGGFRVYLSVLPMPSDYVSSGLVALYDAAYNAGPCEHTDLLGPWVNLADRTGLTDVPLSYSYGDIISKGSIVLGKAVHKSKSEIFAAGDKVLTIEMNARPGDEGLKTFGAVVGVPGVGTLGWSGSDRSGSVVFRQVLEQWYFPTYEMTDYRNFSDLLGSYLTYSVVRNDTKITPFIDSEQMTRTSSAALVTPVGDPFLGVALGNASPGVKADLRSVRIYNRELTPAELSANRRIDAARFDSLPLETAAVSDYIADRGLFIVVK